MVQAFPDQPQALSQSVSVLRHGRFVRRYTAGQRRTPAYRSMARAVRIGEASARYDPETPLDELIATRLAASAIATSEIAVVPFGRGEVTELASASLRSGGAR